MRILTVHARTLSTLIAGMICLPLAGSAAALPLQEPATGRQPAQPRQKEESKRPPEASYRLDVTVFQVSVPGSKADTLEAESLEAQANTPAALREALQAVGATKLLYRFDRLVTTGRPARLEATANIPFAITDPRGAGQPQAVAREQIGAKFDVFAESPEEGSPKLRINTEGNVSLVSEQELEGDSPRTVPVFRKMAASFDGLTEVGKPVVFLSVDTNTTGDEPGTALVVRVLISRE